MILKLSSTVVEDETGIPYSIVRKWVQLQKEALPSNVNVGNAPFLHLFGYGEITYNDNAATEDFFCSYRNYVAQIEHNDIRCKSVAKTTQLRTDVNIASFTPLWHPIKNLRYGYCEFFNNSALVQFKNISSTKNIYGAQHVSKKHCGIVLAHAYRIPTGSYDAHDVITKTNDIWHMVTYILVILIIIGGCCPGINRTRSRSRSRGSLYRS